MSAMEDSPEPRRLNVKPLATATIRKLLLDQLPPGTQLSNEAIEVARAHWQKTIQTWAKDCLLAELEATNQNPNKPKGRNYVYRRITGLMMLRAVERLGREEK